MDRNRILRELIRGIVLERSAGRDDDDIRGLMCRHWEEDVVDEAFTKADEICGLSAREHLKDRFKAA